jgi:hypothetical protein
MDKPQLRKDVLIFFLKSLVSVSEVRQQLFPS